MKGVESLRMQSFKGFWKSRKIPGSGTLIDWRTYLAQFGLVNVCNCPKGLMQCFSSLNEEVGRWPRSFCHYYCTRVSNLAAVYVKRP